MTNQQQRLRPYKQTLRNWFRGQDDAYLTRVLDEGRAGTLCFGSTNHCLLGLRDVGYQEGLESGLTHSLDLASPYSELEYAFNIVGNIGNYEDAEGLRRARTIPIVLAEIKRRTRALTPKETQNDQPTKTQV